MQLKTEKLFMRMETIRMSRQELLAELGSVSESTFCRWNRDGWPELPAMALCYLLGCERGDLFEEVGP
jgi:hypothetical protein